jgi:hypothetical protein
LDWGGQQAACVDSADILDAVICAIVAGAVAVGRSAAPAPEEAALVLEEGWIHLPDAEFLRSPFTTG